MKRPSTMMALVICILVVLMCSLMPVLAINSLANNSSTPTPKVENSAPNVAELPPSVSVTTATTTATPTAAPTATPSATPSVPPTAGDLTATAPANTSEASSTAPIAQAIVGAAHPAVVSATPNSQTITSQPDQPSFLNLSIACTDQGGWQQLGKLDVWLCINDVPKTQVSNVVEVLQPSSGSGVNGYYTVTIAFQYWYPYNPTGAKYQVEAIVYDTKGVASNTQYLGNYQYTRTTGFTIDTSGSLNFGLLTYNQTSSTQQITIHNSGNGPIAVDAQASAWNSTAPGASIVPVGSLQVSATGASWQSMTTTAVSVQNMQIPSGNSTSTPIYWREVVPSQITVPVLAGPYATIGILTVIAK